MSPSNGGLTYAKRAFIDYGVSPASHGREPAAAAASRTCDACSCLRAVVPLLAEQPPQTPVTRLRRVAGTPLKWAAACGGAQDRQNLVAGALRPLRWIR